MSSANIDPAAILNRALEYAAQNLRVEKLLIQLGLDPANITYDVVFNRLVDIVLANINFANMLALVGATLYVVTLMVRTIVPLRIIGIISMVFFIAYGALAGAVATFLLYLLSLPINIIRLRQMLNLVKKARVSAQGDLSMDWLRPFMTPRKCKKGEVLFRQGRCRQGDVLHGQRQVPGQGDRHRACRPGASWASSASSIRKTGGPARSKASRTARC